MFAFETTFDIDRARQISRKIRAVLDVCLEIAELSEPRVAGFDDFSSYVHAIRCLKVVLDSEDTIVGYELQVPTSSAGWWLSEVDPFLLADGLREIGVEMRISVFDIENQVALSCVRRISQNRESPFATITLE